MTDRSESADDPIDRATKNLRRTMRDTWRICRMHAAATRANEEELRKQYIELIRDHLEARSLNSFDSTHLSFLEILLFFWREEIEDGDRVLSELLRPPG